MSKILDKKTSEAVRDRLRFYRDLGVWDLYRREVPEALLAQLAAAESVPEAAAVAAAQESAEVEREELAKAKKSAAVVEEVPVAPSRPRASASVADRGNALRIIREDLGDCTRCVLHEQGRKQIVFGVGNLQADIMFVGEGPGADEDEQGEPFVGRAGQLLNNMINAMGIKREDVYIANVVKCRPPGNRTPEREECDTCSPFLMRQIAVVQPKIIVALGAVAAKTLLGINDSMANLRGKIYDFHPPVPKDSPEHAANFSTKLVATYHPAYLLRDPRQKKEAWKDLQIVMKYLGMAVPAKSSE